MDPNGLQIYYGLVANRRSWVGSCMDESVCGSYVCFIIVFLVFGGKVICVNR